MTPRRFSASDRQSDEPQHEEHGRDDPQQVSCESDTEEQQNYQKSHYQ